MPDRAEEVAQQICADLFPDGWGPLSEALIVPILRAFAAEARWEERELREIATRINADLQAGQAVLWSDAKALNALIRAREATKA